MNMFQGMPQADADALRAGGLDAYGAIAEQAVSDGARNPCRCCLRHIPKGADMLIAAYRPFGTLQPYAETGPVFLCAEACENEQVTFPEVLSSSPDYLLKGYSADERIIYGTGQITASEQIESYAAELLSRSDIAFVDVRSARNNCWQVRIARAS